MFKRIALSLAIVSVIGCSAGPIKKAVYTEDGYVIAARTKQVEVQALRANPFRTTDGAWLDTWHIRLANNDKQNAWCASIEWRNMDYNIYVANVWYHLPPYSEMNVGTAIQEVWNFTGTHITIDDAAFSVYRLNILKPNDGKCVAKRK